MKDMPDLPRLYRVFWLEETEYRASRLSGLTRKIPIFVPLDRYFQVDTLYPFSHSFSEMRVFLDKF